jgi:hypothetical protein
VDRYLENLSGMTVDDVLAYAVARSWVVVKTDPDRVLPGEICPEPHESDPSRWSMPTEETAS